MSDDCLFDDDAFLRLLIIKNDAEPKTLKHSLIEFMNSSTVLEDILGRDYTSKDTHKMIIIFTNLFNEHYNLPEDTWFEAKTYDVLTEIFKAWWVEVEAEIKAAGRVAWETDNPAAFYAAFKASQDC